MADNEKSTAKPTGTRKRQTTRQRKPAAKKATPAPTAAEKEPVEQTTEAPVADQTETQADLSQAPDAVGETAAATGDDAAAVTEGADAQGSQSSANVPDAEAPAETAEPEQPPFTEGLSGGAAALVMTVEQYADTMAAGKPMDPSRGKSQQMLLYRTLISILNLDGQDFYGAMGALLRIVHENRQGAFAERRLFRFFPDLQLSSDQRKSFERLLNLFVASADPATRAQVSKQVDIEGTAASLKNAELEQRLIAYYQ